MEKMKRYSCLCVDPPWKFGDNLPGKGRGASKHYPCMPLEDIIRFELPPTTPDCWLFLWRVASMQSEAIAVATAWGFTIKSEIVWVKTSEKTGKVRIGMGRTVRNAHEVCLVCTRGKPARASGGVPSVITAPRGVHSAKPEEVQDAIEKLVGNVPKAELFARRVRDGWDCFGNQIVAATAAE